MLDKQAVAILAVLFGAWLGYYLLYYQPRYEEYVEDLREYEQRQEDRAEDEDDGEDAAPVDTGDAAGADDDDAGTAESPDPATGEDDGEDEDERANGGAAGDAPWAVHPKKTVSMETAEHEVVLDSAGASLSSLTFRHHDRATYAPVSEDVREAGPYQPLRPFPLGDEVRSFALEPLDPDLGWVASEPWEHEPLEGGGHRFVLELPEEGLRLVKTYAPPEPLPEDLPKDLKPYHLELTVRVENTGDAPRRFGYRLHGPVGMINQASGRTSLGIQTVTGSVQGGGVALHDPVLASELQQPVSARRNEDGEDPYAVDGEISYYGLGTQYFAAVVVPEKGERRVRRTVPIGVLPYAGERPRPAPDDPNAVGHQALVYGVVPEDPSGPPPIASKDYREDTYKLYVGPRQKLLFEHEESPYAGFGLEYLVDFGWFEALVRVLLAVLFGLHAIVGNWGVAIILLTFLVRGLLLPLSIWSQKNMMRMQRLAPQMNELKEKYTKEDGSMSQDQQRAFQAAQMELFRKEGVNPVGCVGPIFLQMPIFIGLWNALNYSFELRQQPFAFWIDDLSVPDVLFRLPFDIPLIGTDAFSVLPLLMVASYLLQQKLQPAPADPRAAEQQKMMKWIMPVFGFILYTFPSGLMLYFLTSNLWSMIEMKTIRKWTEQKEGASQPAPSGKTG